MGMSDKHTAFDQEENLRWCLQIQRERIQRGLLCEIVSQKLSPGLHRELLTFAKIAQAIGSNSECTNSQPDGAGATVELPGQIEVRENIRNLNPEDRQRLRETFEEIEANLEQAQTSNVERDLVNPKGHINDKRQSSDE